MMRGRESYPLGQGIGEFGKMLRTVSCGIGEVFPDMAWDEVHGLSARAVQAVIGSHRLMMEVEALALAVEDEYRRRS